jgi:hypothetical protein
MVGEDGGRSRGSDQSDGEEDERDEELDDGEASRRAATTGSEHGAKVVPWLAGTVIVRTPPGAKRRARSRTGRHV